MEKQTNYSVEIGGVRFASPNEFSAQYSIILNEWFEKGPITSGDLERVAALFDAHPERVSKLRGSRAIDFVSARKAQNYQRGPTFRVVLENDETVSFGISTVRSHLWPKTTRTS